MRYWGALGLRMRGHEGVKDAAAELRQALDDTAPIVRITAAEALGKFGTADDLRRVLPLLVELSDWSKQDVFTAVAGLHALDALGPKAADVADQVAKLPVKGKVPHARYSPYVPRLLQDVPGNLRKIKPAANGPG